MPNETGMSMSAMWARRMRRYDWGVGASELTVELCYFSAVLFLSRGE